MASPSQEIRNIDQLRTYIQNVICQHEQLEPNAFRLTQQILFKAGRPCGIYFCLHGPRAVKLSAIWETERNSVLFYDSNGERFRKDHLCEAPEMELAVA